MQTLRILRRLNAFLLAMLALWAGLAFCGVQGLVPACSAADGALFHAALAFQVVLFAGLWLTLRDHRRAEVLVAAGAAAWLIVQYAVHWHPLLFPPGAERIARYYDRFDTWRLLPRLPDRIVPDGYHTVLILMLAAVLLVSLARLRLRRRRAVAPRRARILGATIQS
ncbi:MAG: hypothetical protein JW819_02315 [Candidatus Krumholzibacteriota bacterium]|nr:hypothetical protein [Candidatus Krumholzibacteriota bacterium]